MKLTKMAFAAAVAWGIYAGSAHAQQTQGLPASYSAADYYYFQQDAAASPSDQAPAVQADKMMVQAPAGSYDVCLDEEAAECEAWRLFCQKECGWNVYGWLSGGHHGQLAVRDPQPLQRPGDVQRSREGQFNQGYVIIEDTIDTGGCGFDWGGRVDLLYGTDYIFTMATGLETDRRRESQVEQQSRLRLGLAAGLLGTGLQRLSVKLGHFYTVIGYEVVPANGNFFYTHAYTMQYGEPFTHTGGIATWKVADDLSVIGAFVNGWDAFDRVHDAGMGIGGFIFNATDNLTIAYTYGYSVDEPTTWGGYSPRNISSLVATYNRDDWTYVIQNDIGWQDDAIQNQGSSLRSAEWYGINQYLFYTINDCWKAGMRVEWFRDDDGVRVGGPAARPDDSHVGLRRQLLQPDGWPQLDASRQLDRPARSSLRLVRRRNADRSAAVQRRRRRQPDHRGLRRDLPVVSPRRGHLRVSAA
jgi:hypothetical protein